MGIFRRAAAAAVWGLMAATIACGSAYAAVSVNKSFDPISIPAYGVSRLTITLLNTGSNAAMSANLMDVFPAGMVVADPPNLTNGCGGTVTPASNGVSLQLAGGAIPAASTAGPGSCDIAIDVTSTTAGNPLNTVAAGGLTSSEGTNNEAAEATLTVTSLAQVTGTKAFDPVNIHGGASHVLTITLTNRNTVPLTNVSFTDTFPAPLVLASPSNASTTCGGGTVDVSVASQVRLNAGTIPASGNCTVTVSVTASDPSTFQDATLTNTVPAGNLVSAQGVSNAAIARAFRVQKGARMLKAFATSPVLHGDSSSFTITLENYNRTPLTPVTFTDPMPNGVTATSATTDCADATVSHTNTSVTLTGATVAAATSAIGPSTCKVVVGYTASNTTQIAFDAINKVPANTAGGVSLAEAQGRVTINPVPGDIAVSKSFSGAPYAQGGSATLTITLSNKATADATITSFSDLLTTMRAGYTVGGTVTTNCAGTGNVNAPIGGTSIALGGGNKIPANSSCTITAPIAISPTADVGSTVSPPTNTIAAGGLRTSRGPNGAAASASITVARGLAIEKTFNPTTVISGIQTSVLTVKLTRAAGAPSLTGIAFTDTFPTSPYAMKVHTIPAATTDCEGGVVTANPGSGSFTLSGARLPVPAAGAGTASSCSVSVTVGVPDTASGVANNVIAANTVTNTPGVQHALVSTPLTARRAAPSLAKGFSPATIALGATSQLTIRIQNNNADSVNLTGVDLSDTLPTGMVIANPPAASFSGSGCSTTTPSATAGGNVLALAGATVSAGSTCILRVNVRSTVAGNVINTIPRGALKSAELVTTLGPASATLASTGRADLYVTKQRTSAAPVVAGNSVTYSVVVGNKGPDAVAGARFTDAVPAGASSMAWACSGASCPAASGTGAIDSFLTLAKDETVAFDVTLQLPPSASGNLVNTARIAAPSTVVDPVPTNNSATTTDTITNVAALTLSKTDGSQTYTPGSTATYTIVVGNNGPSNATAVTLSDALPTGVTLTAAPTCTAAGTANCGTPSGSAGGNSFGATGASIAVGAGNTLSFTAPVAFAAAMNTNPLVNTASATPAGGSPASAQDSNTLLAKADLVVTKKASQPTDGTYLPGQPLNYSITVQNNGPSDAIGVKVTDTVPDTVIVSSWTCVASTSTGAGADCDNTTPGTDASGSTNTISLSNVTLPVGKAIAIEVLGKAALTSTDKIENTVRVEPPAGFTCTTAPCTKAATATNTNAGSPQLSVGKTANPKAFAVGQPGSYAIMVTNVGTSATIGSITVSDSLPNGITTTSKPIGTGWDCDASTTTVIQCTSNAVLIPGASAPVINVAVAVAVGAASPSRNEVRVTGGGDAACKASGPTPARCVGAVDTVVNAPNIDVSKTLEGTLVVGVQTQYIITATNNGQAATLAGTLTDTIPTGLTIGTLPQGCTGSGQAITCDIPADLPTGGQVRYEVPVTPDASVNGQPLSNTATANAAGDPGCPAATHCSSTATGTVKAPQLKLEKSVNPTTLVVGQVARYTLTVTNDGSAATTAAAAVSDTIPAGLTVGQPPAGCTVSGQDVSCTVSAGLAPTGSTAFQIPVTAQAALIGQSVKNAAAVKGGGDPGCASGTDDANLPARCKASVDTPVSAPQLTIVKKASADLTVGVPATYTLEVTNTGSATTFGTISLTDVIPGSLIIGTLPSGCTRAGQQISCTSSEPLAVKGVLSFVIPVTPTATSAPRVSNTASVQGGGDPTCPTTANCTSTVVSNVAAPTLQITATANGPWTIGQAGTAYTLTVTNAGPATTAGVVTVNATLPPGLTPGWAGTHTSDGWTCTAAGQDVNCTATPNLASANSANFNLPVNVLAAAFPSVTTALSVGGGGDPFNGGTAIAAGAACNVLDSARPGHCAEVTTPIPASGAITTVKTLDTGIKTPLVAGQTITYVLTATNSGGTTVANYAVHEVVPTGTVFASVTGGATTCAAGAAAGTLCTVTFTSVPAGASASVRIGFTLVRSLPLGIKQIVNAITESSKCTGAQCDPPPLPPNCTGSSCTPANACTAGDPHCVSTPVSVPDGAVPIPTVSEWMLIVMAALLTLMAWPAQLRRQRGD